MLLNALLIIAFGCTVSTPSKEANRKKTKVIFQKTTFTDENMPVLGKPQTGTIVKENKNGSYNVITPIGEILCINLSLDKLTINNYKNNNEK